MTPKEETTLGERRYWYFCGRFIVPPSCSGRVEVSQDGWFSVATGTDGETDDNTERETLSRLREGK